MAKLPNYHNCAKTKDGSDKIPNVTVMHAHSLNSFEARLRAKTCEICGTETSEHYEIHHVKKVKGLKGKAVWEQIMIAKRRKTIVVCRECHKRIHGKIAD